MARIELKYTQKKYRPCLVLVDDQIIPLKKLSKNHYCVEIPTNQKINLKIVSYNELIEKNWLSRFLLYYVIGLFGLFTPKYDKCPYLLAYEANISITQDLTIFINDYKEKALGFSQNYETFDNVTNQYYIDGNIKKRIGIIRMFKVFTFFIYALLILFLILNYK